MIVALLLSTLAAGSRAASDCPASFQPSYESNWGVTRAQWEAGCSSGSKPDDILRARQGEFMSRCQSYFTEPAEKAKVPAWNLPVLCAQGADGEAKLAALTGAAPRKRPVEPSVTPPPAAAAKVDHAARNPAQRLYNAVESEGSLFPTKLEAPRWLPPRAKIRYKSLDHLGVYVTMEGPPICATLIGLGDACGGKYFDGWFVDRGCTGEAATMTFEPMDENLKAPQACDQAEVDAVMTRGEKYLFPSRVQFEKPRSR